MGLIKKYNKMKIFIDLGNWDINNSKHSFQLELTFIQSILKKVINLSSAIH